MNRVMSGLAGIFAGLVFMGSVAMADVPAAIMETYTGDAEISVYVKGIKADSDISVQIATAEAETDIQMISELDVSMRTLVMIDNSLSISEENRDKISEFLQNLIADRTNGEEICIAVFGENITKLTEYISDYTELKRAAESIVYEDQETYLTDVLYDLLIGEFKENGKELYRRIVVVSDGVDNKSLGYTKDELYSLLKEVRIPIYTVGSLGEKKNNNEELTNMFALSRMTSAEAFLLDDMEDILDITESLKNDREIRKLTITPSKEMMDGSRKTLKITMSDGSVLTTEVTMPQQTYVKEETQTPPSVMEEQGGETEPIVEKQGSETESVAEEAAGAKPKFIFGALVAASLAAIAAIAAFIFGAYKKERSRTESEKSASPIKEGWQRDADKSDGRTEIIGGFSTADNEGSTVIIWEQEAEYQVILTDVNSPAKSFQMPLNLKVVIGRKQGECDIVLDYEKSISSKHCEISVRNGKFYVRDLQSSNGTYLNGDKVLTETEIVSGNILKLGRLELRFEVR